MHPRHSARALAILATVTAVVVGLTAPVGAAAEPPDHTAAAVAFGEASGITLLTGDRVEVAQSADGRRAATITPGPGREQVTFQTIEVDGVLQVLPSDAVPFVASGVIDDSLFEVSTLIEEGYADLKALPLIVAWSPGVRAETMTVAGAEQSRALPSIDGAALSAEVDDLGQVWEAITGGAVAETPFTPPVMSLLAVAMVDVLISVALRSSSEWVQSTEAAQPVQEASAEAGAAR